jgi:hypothetical protein
LNGLTGVRAQQFAGSGIRRLVWEQAGLRNADIHKYEKRRLQMAMQAILWIVAGAFLALLIVRRGKRKAKAS